MIELIIFETLGPFREDREGWDAYRSCDACGETAAKDLMAQQPPRNFVRQHDTGTVLCEECFAA